MTSYGPFYMTSNMSFFDMTNSMAVFVLQAMNELVLNQIGYVT